MRVHYANGFMVLSLVQVIYSDEERRYNREITVGLIRSELINLSDYNVQLTKLMDGGRNSTFLKSLCSGFDILKLEYFESLSSCYMPTYFKFITL